MSVVASDFALVTMASPATLEIRKLRLMTAVKTPYREDGNVDISALDRIVEHQIANGVEGIIIGGTTGEGHLFTWEEHLMLIAHIKTKFMGRVAVVGNTGSNATAESVAATKKGFAYGMDASLLINPYYGKTSIEGIIRHIEVRHPDASSFDVTRILHRLQWCLDQRSYTMSQAEPART